jgi:rubrerythrin
MEKELQLQRAKRAEFKNMDKLYEATILQEKRVARAAAKVTREQEKAEQAASRAQEKSARSAKRHFNNVLNLLTRVISEW